jgi:hypothetical protein
VGSCEVVFIPTRQEYLDAGLSLWVSRDEQVLAQQEVASEVRDLLDNNPSLSIRMATNFLYQPRLSDHDTDCDDNDADNDHDRVHSDLLSATTVASTTIPDKPRRRTDFNGQQHIDSGSGSKGRSHSLTSASPPSYSHSKQRLNIVVAATTVAQFETTKRSLHRVLLPYERWVLSCTHCLDDVQTLEWLFQSAHSRVSQADVVLIDESICELVMDRHDADVKALVEDVKSASNEAVVGLLLLGDNNEIGNESGNDGCGIAHNPQHKYIKDSAKRGGVDFMWKRPIQHFVQMLPLLLAANQSKKVTARSSSSSSSSCSQGQMSPVRVARPLHNQTTPSSSSSVT